MEISEENINFLMTVLKEAEVRLKALSITGNPAINKTVLNKVKDGLDFLNLCLENKIGDK
jgi:hypothetical protein